LKTVTAAGDELHLSLIIRMNGVPSGIVTHPAGTHAGDRAAPRPRRPPNLFYPAHHRAATLPSMMLNQACNSSLAIRRKHASTRTLLRAVLGCLMMVGLFSSAHALTQEELVAKLNSAGYSQVRDIKSSAEGASVKATKNGKEVTVVVDSSGQIQEKH